MRTSVAKITLAECASLYSTPAKVVTWNVNAKVESVEGIQELLLDPHGPDGELIKSSIDVKLLVISLQEMVELSTTNVIENSVNKHPACEETFNSWRVNLEEALRREGSELKYVDGGTLVGIALFLFAASDIFGHIRDLQVQTLPRGVGGLLGNKGAVYLRFQLYDSSICIIGAHFAAHREALLKRNEDFHAILNTHVFVDDLNALAMRSTANMIEATSVTKLRDGLAQVKKKFAALTQNAKSDVKLESKLESKSESRSRFFDDTNNNSNHSKRDRYSANEHDLILWMGDLNYRIVASLDMERVYDMIDCKAYLNLSAYDQLNQEREKNTVFQNFYEGLLTFPPTYQYIAGQDEYDRRKDKKMRCPAWCDRILWRVGQPAADIDDDDIDARHQSAAESDDDDSEDEGLVIAGHHSNIELINASTSSVFPIAANTSRHNSIKNLSNVSFSSCIKTDKEQQQEGGAEDDIIYNSDDDDEDEALDKTPHSPQQRRMSLERQASEEELAEKVRQRHNSFRLDSANSMELLLAYDSKSEGMQVVASHSETEEDPTTDEHKQEKEQRKQEDESGLEAMETVELMSYTRRSNLISDHKPVAALFNIKLKRYCCLFINLFAVKITGFCIRVDWAKHEKLLIDRMRPILQEPVASPLLNTVLSPSWYTIRQVDTTLQPLSPLGILLRSVTKEGTGCQIHIENRSSTHIALWQLQSTSIPSWLTVEPMAAGEEVTEILPYQSILLSLRNHHEGCNMALISEIEQNKDFSEYKIPLPLPPGNGCMQVCAMLEGTLTWHRYNLGQENNFGSSLESVTLDEAIGEEALKNAFKCEVKIPVCVSLTME